MNSVEIRKWFNENRNFLPSTPFYLDAVTKIIDIELFLDSHLNDLDSKSPHVLSSSLSRLRVLKQIILNNKNK